MEEYFERYSEEACATVIAKPDGIAETVLVAVRSRFAKSNSSEKIDCIAKHEIIGEADGENPASAQNPENSWVASENIPLAFENPFHEHT